MTELVRQRFTADCCVACLAMFLGVDYEAVVRHMSGWELTHGGTADSRERHIAQLFKVEIEFLDRYLLDRSCPAVLTVPSVNSDAGATHAVYWDGKALFDPNDGRPGKDVYDAETAWEMCISGYQRRGLGPV